MKMKVAFLATLFVQVISATSASKDAVSEMVSVWRRFSEPYMNECMCQGGAKPEMLHGYFHYGEIINEPCFKCTIRCLVEKANMFSPSGTLNFDRYREMNPHVREDILQKCGQYVSKDKCQQIYDISFCLINSTRAAQQGTYNVVVGPTAWPLTRKSSHYQPMGQIYYPNK